MNELIDILSLPLLITSGLIAIIGFNTKHRWIGAVLFIEFLMMTGYQEILLDPESGVYFYEYTEMAPFFMYKMLIQALFTMGYIYLAGRGLAVISAAIMANLVISVCLSLYDMQAVYYEHIMLSLSVLQLIVGTMGAINGHWHNLNSILHSFAFRRHKGL